MGGGCRLCLDPAAETRLSRRNRHTESRLRVLGLGFRGLGFRCIIRKEDLTRDEATRIAGNSNDLGRALGDCIFSLIGLN